MISPKPSETARILGSSPKFQRHGARTRLSRGGAGDSQVQHWGRIGTGGQSQVKEFGSKDEAVKALNKKFKSKAGVAFAERGAAAGPGAAPGKYHTLAEQRAAVNRIE